MNIMDKRPKNKTNFPIKKDVKLEVGHSKKVMSGLSENREVPEWAQDPKKKYDKFGYEINSKKYEQDLNYIPKSYVDKPIPGKSASVRVLIKKDLAPSSDATYVKKTKILLRNKKQ